MIDTEQVTPRTSLGTQLRDVVVEHVQAEQLTDADLATRLGLHRDVVQSLFNKPHWDLDLGLRIVQRLNVPFRLTRG